MGSSDEPDMNTPQESSQTAVVRPESILVILGATADVISIVLAVHDKWLAGVLVGVVAAVGAGIFALTKPQPHPRSVTALILMVAILGAACAGVSGVLWYFGSTTADPPPRAVHATIEYPADGQMVAGWNLMPGGSVDDNSVKLLCISKDESGNYFPYAAPVTSGRWRSGFTIGPEKDVKRPYSFTIIIATITPQAMEQIHALQDRDPKYNTHGIGTQLPNGVQELAHVQISRTS